MKKDLLKFQIPKEAMNELRGGRLIYHCRCGMGANITFKYAVLASSSTAAVDSIVDHCPDAVGGCYL